MRRVALWIGGGGLFVYIVGCVYIGLKVLCDNGNKQAGVYYYASLNQLSEINCTKVSKQQEWSARERNQHDERHIFGIADGLFDPMTVTKYLGIKFFASPIPEQLISFVKSTQSPFQLPQCIKQSLRHNFVYLKTHKTASDTLSSLFRRYAFERNLSQVLPVHVKFNMGWPYDFNSSFHRPSKARGFNTLVDHCKYTPSYLGELMPPDTVYITSLRDTFGRLKSAISYFHVTEWTRLRDHSNGGPRDHNNDSLRDHNYNSIRDHNNDSIRDRNDSLRGDDINNDYASGADVVATFLKDMKHYDDIYKQPSSINPRRPSYHCVPPGISVVRNSMAGDLGFPIGFPADIHPDLSDNPLAIQEWLAHINTKFSVVLISDYFNHSLVMLKRMMCWPSHKDILYKRMNSQSTHYGHVRAEMIDNFRRWSAADYLAFELFNRTLWERIAQWGWQDFMAELKRYEEVLQETLIFCKQLTRDDGREVLHIEASAWSHAFYIDTEDCNHIKSNMRKEMRKQYDDNPIHVKEMPHGKVPLC